MKTMIFTLKAAVLSFCALFSWHVNVNAQSGNILYGVALKGGAYDMGVIFHLDPATGTQTVDYSFTEGTHYDNDMPSGSLTLYDGILYGMTTLSGAGNQGMIYSWDPVSNSFDKKIDFTGSENGKYPYGSLTLSNGMFYGMTAEGGANNGGVIFEWDPAINLFVKKIDFDGVYVNYKGRLPIGSLTGYNGKLYGMTAQGGSYWAGVLFEWDPVTNEYSKKIDFDWNNGANPTGSLTVLNGKLYGVTQAGGANSWGNIFEWDPVSNSLVTKFEFVPGYTGHYPPGTLTYHNGKFYGTTTFGGGDGVGTLFEWDPVTNEFNVMKSFDENSNERFPYGSVTLCGDKLYGMTSGGWEGQPIPGYGNIFSWDPATSTYTHLFDFDNNNGSFPYYNQLTVYNMGNCAPGKVLICHHTGGPNNPNVELCVSENAVAAHLAHGDNIGPCSSGKSTRIFEEDGTEPLKVYPNPADESVKMTFHSETADEVIIQLINMEGRVACSIKSKAVEGDNNYEVDLRNMATGIYMARIRNSSSEWTSRLAVIH